MNKKKKMSVKILFIAYNYLFTRLSFKNNLFLLNIKKLLQEFASCLDMNIKMEMEKMKKI